MYDETKNLIGFQGRALGKSLTKYITVMFDEEAPKFMDWTQSTKNYLSMWSKDPLTATFICNSIAMCGSDGDISYLGD